MSGPNAEIKPGNCLPMNLMPAGIEIHNIEVQKGRGGEDIGVIPHGGGEGRSPVGMPGPKTPWGKPALGYKTRKPKASDKMIVKRRGK